MSSTESIFEPLVKNKWLVAVAAALYLGNNFVQNERAARKALQKTLQAREKQIENDRKEMMGLMAKAMRKMDSQSSALKEKTRTASIATATLHEFFESRISKASSDGKTDAASAEAVASWIVDLNPAFTQYRERFIEKGVNAAVLFSLTDKMLLDELDITSSLHRSAILKFRSEANFQGQQTEMKLPRRDTKNNEPLNIAVLKSKQGLEDVDFSDKRVLMRVDYNVPLDAQGNITDTARIDATIESIKYILDASDALKAQGKAGIKSLALICHLGRPPTGLEFDRKKYSVKPCKVVLEAALEVPVEFLSDCVGEAVEKKVLGCTDGSVFLLENLRFHMEETGKAVNERGDTISKASKEQIAVFATKLSKLGDVFVFEAFGAAHRAHASVVGITCAQRVAGMLMKKELDTYAGVLGNPQRPFLGVVGGAKVSDKIQVLMNLLDVVDELIIGGGMAYTFKSVLHDVKIGASMYQADSVELVKQVARKAAAKGIPLHLPVDHIIGDGFSENCKVGFAMDSDGIPDGWLGMDVGPQSRTINAQAIARAKTILWNGPLGVVEWGHFAAGTASCMFHMVEATKKGCISIIGGGDTGAAAAHYYYGASPVATQISHVSTGGGSSLVLMEGKMLPAVPCLSDKRETQTEAKGQE